ncbi:MAG: ArnT family glycosyltransferase [Candidatus Thorarchaeota archaeon]
MHQLKNSRLRFEYLVLSAVIVVYISYVILFFHKSFISDEGGYLYQAKTLVYKGEYLITNSNQNKWFAGRIIPILYYAIIILFFGTDISILRLSTIPIVIVGGLAWFLLIRSLHGRDYGLGALTMYLFAPITLMLGSWNLFEPFSALFIVISLITLNKWTLSPEKWYWLWLTGISIGAGYLCKEDVISCALAIGVFILGYGISHQVRIEPDHSSKLLVTTQLRNIMSYVMGGLLLYVPRLMIVGFTEPQVAMVAQSVSSSQITGTGLIVNPFGGNNIIKIILSAGYALAFIGFVFLCISYYFITQLRDDSKSVLGSIKAIHMVLLAWSIINTSLIVIWTVQARYFYNYSIILGGFLFLINNRRVLLFLMIGTIFGNMIIFGVVGERYEYTDPNMTELIESTAEFIQINVPSNSTIFTTFTLQTQLPYLMGVAEYKYTWIYHGNNSALPNTNGTSNYIVILGLNTLLDVAKNESLPLLFVKSGISTSINLFSLS